MEQETKLQIFQMPIIVQEGLEGKFSVRTYYTEISYQFNAPLHRATTPITFIPDFLHERGYLIRGDRCGRPQGFTHRDNISELSAENTSVLELHVRLDFKKGCVNIDYSVKHDSWPVEDVSDLVLKMMETYLRK